MPDEPYMDVEGAAEALRQMELEADGSEEVVEEQAKTESEAPAPDETTESEAPAEEEDFIPRADLESLIEGLEGEPRDRVIDAYKSMQRGFTKRSQEVSELRRTFEGLDPKEVRQAYDFVQNLGSDPDFAMKVHGELTDALTNAGMSPRAAAQEATRQIEEKVDEVEDLDLDGFEDNPFVQKLTRLEKQQRDFFAQIEADKAAQAEAEQKRRFDEHQNQVIKEIERQDAEIRRQNVNLDDDDMETIYKLAASTEGDLFAAKELYDGLRDRLVTDYVATKKRVPSGGGGGPAGGGSVHSEEPVEILSTDQAHALAVERARHLLGQ